MNVIITILIIVGQIILGYLLGFILSYFAGIGNGWELISMPIGYTIGVWGVGALVAKLRNHFDRSHYAIRFWGTAVCAAIGTAIILLTPPTGMTQILYPFFGAMIGFYLAGFLYKQ